MGGPLTQTTNDALAVVGLVRSGPRIAVDESILERTVDEDRELVGRRGDRFDLTHPEGQAAAEGTERGLGPTEAHGGHARDPRGAVGRRRRRRAEEAAGRLQE